MSDSSSFGLFALLSTTVPIVTQGIAVWLLAMVAFMESKPKKNKVEKLDEEEESNKHDDEQSGSLTTRGWFAVGLGWMLIVSGFFTILPLYMRGYVIESDAEFHSNFWYIIIFGHIIIAIALLLYQFSGNRPLTQKKISSERKIVVYMSIIVAISYFAQVGLSSAMSIISYLEQNSQEPLELRCTQDSKISNNMTCWTTK